MKILFATQPDRDAGEIIPIPEIVLFVNDDKLLDQSYRRFIESRIREKAPYTGLPILIRLRGRQKHGETDGAQRVSRKSRAHHKKR